MMPDESDFWFLPLGGTGEIGMNCNLYAHHDQWLMVDCGVIFNQQTDVDGTLIDDGKPHIQMADPAFISQQKDKLVGLIITHAHEDHIGAVPYLWRQLACPVYTTAFTAEVLRRKLIEAGLDKKVPVIVVGENSTRSIGHFEVEWIKQTHSIAEPYGLIISTSVGKVFHTGDWKLDDTPVVGTPLDKVRCQKLADESIDIMVCDSTNANVAGHSLSEGVLYKGLHHHIEQASGRVVVTCFGSNIARLETLAKIADATGRYLGLLGRSLINMVAAAKASGVWQYDKTIVDPEHLAYLPPHSLLLVATGSQGEPKTALNRLSTGSFRDLELEPNDTVIFSSKMIPGNELAIETLIARLKAMQVNVITDENSAYPIHASGHPAQDELNMMYQWVKPNAVIPVHGETHHLKANAKVAQRNGITTQLIGQNGDLFFIAPHKGIRRKAVKTGRLGLVANKLVKIE